MATAKTYSELLKDPRWQKMRLFIMERDNFSCISCGDTEQTLNVHHLAYRKNTKIWDYDSSEFITLCEECHSYISQNVEHSISIIRKNGNEVDQSYYYFDILAQLDECTPDILKEVGEFIRNLKRQWKVG